MMSNTQTLPCQHTLANLTKTERNFLEYFYVQVYTPPSMSEGKTNMWNPGMPTTFTRQLIRSICISYGYGGTIHWIVRKQFGRRLADRGLYNIPELAELHELWTNTENLSLTINTNAGNIINVNRKFNG